MGNQDSEKPISFRRGALCDLLASGIEPGEVLTYALDRCGNSGAQARLAQWSPDVADDSAKTLGNAASVLRRLRDVPLVVPFAPGDLAQRTVLGKEGHHLKPVSASQAEMWLSPIAPRLVRDLGALADTLDLIGGALAQVVTIQKRRIGRPASENEHAFIRGCERFVAVEEVRIKNASGEWQVQEIPRAGTLMKNNSGRHRTLDRQGAHIFNAIFQKSITAASFRRYRLASEPAKK